MSYTNRHQDRQDVLMSVHFISCGCSLVGLVVAVVVEMFKLLHLVEMHSYERLLVSSSWVVFFPAHLT